jgi:hypothetical protein
MALVGGQARVRVTAASATSSTDNAATLSTSGTLLTIDSTAKRHWNRASSTHVVVFEGATNRTTDIAEINYVQGKVTLDTAHSTATAWTIDVEHLTSSYVANANAWAIDVDVEMLDKTSFSTVASSTGDVYFRSVTPGLAGSAADLERFVTADTTGPAFFDRLTSTQDTVLELVLDSNTLHKFEGFAYVSEDPFDVPLDALANESVGFTFDGTVYHSTD